MQCWQSPLLHLFIKQGVDLDDRPPHVKWRLDWLGRDLVIDLLGCRQGFWIVFLKAVGKLVKVVPIEDQGIEDRQQAQGPLVIVLGPLLGQGVFNPLPVFLFDLVID